MDQKCILITGAASGIGRETAVLFAGKGWYVGAFDVDEAGLKTLEAEIGQSNCHIGHMDVTDPDSVSAGIDAFAGKTGGRLDVLVNNAGILKFGRFEDVDLGISHKIVDVNLKGCLSCIYYAMKYLKETPGSRIINLSSASAIYGIPELAVYSATKHALSAMTEALAIEFSGRGIRVSDIQPPYVKTPMLADSEHVYSIKKMGVRVQPVQVARTVWKAVHKDRLHWLMGSGKLLKFLCWIMPFGKGAIVKMLTMGPEGKKPEIV
ncbi:MAG: SDR family oxidoreductase [Desulfobacterales bacterium]|nr:SDR family oxidoreductase [Desulfobacterales bacterium]